MILALVNEHGQTVSLLQDTLGVLTDPAHIIAELVISIAFEIIQFVVIYYIWKKLIKPRFFAQIHAEVDAEHGIEHHDGHVHENVHVPIGGCVPLPAPQSQSEAPMGCHPYRNTNKAFGPLK